MLIGEVVNVKQRTDFSLTLLRGPDTLKALVSDEVGRIGGRVVIMGRSYRPKMIDILGR